MRVIKELVHQPLTCQSGVANMRSDTVWYFNAIDIATTGGKVNLGFDLAKLGLEVTK
ncbi:hypothetical protein [Abyssogena phaseoliformis symbiont]|uniref:hypothetical protein n=1 Tax=Abyssogena phaseoliformis symbiont TaxID=596095 RepID=UPI0019155EFF|nr:hypothetical protein [Abyssogena phaseoliformis symbiont]MBW5288778.1 hypothetical protein [Candidatus Ruthia sp. Apha_13_S6]